MKHIVYFSFFLLFFSNLNAAINLIKKENSDSNTTLLVIGGIHGNEPGGYFAAAILATHYKIKTKNLWIVPNLNQESIIHFTRGIHGDMNRKFAYIKKHDKDKKIVEAIKKIILSKNVSLVLNLHDGHGFYRKDNKGSIFNPNAWGQTCVIDQCKLTQQQPYGDLNNIAITVKDNINKKLLQKHHSFNVKNTNTKYEDEAMKLSLTYFAVTHNKPAFAIETSKNLSSLSQKVFYQLVAIEEYMKIMGIEYSRDFNLNQNSITKIIKNYGNLIINHNILLNLCNIKKSLSYIPIKSRSNKFNFSNPLGEIRKVKETYFVYLANRLVTKLQPQYFELSDNCQETYEIEVDGKTRFIPKASEFFAKKNFKIRKSSNIRVNVIGFYKKGKPNESNITISYRDLHKKYSVDKDEKVYRIEFYKKNKFCSMVMVHFK